LLAGLTGRVSDLGIAGRDGATLAVEQINREGGIHGRTIQLIIRDDKQNDHECERVVKELIAEGVVAIVGPMTSSMALVAVPLTNKHEILTIGPTVSTDKLADFDDYFFRIIPVSTNAAARTALYAYNEKGYRNLFVIYDNNNRAYTESWYQQLKFDFESFGGKIGAVSYGSRPGNDFLKLTKEVLKENLDCLIILANAMDTAMISQQLFKLGAKVPVIVSEWSFTEALLEFGGNAVEGIEIFHSFNKNNTSESYLEFSEDFQKRFGYFTDFASTYAYDAANIVISALQKDTDHAYLKKNGFSILYVLTGLVMWKGSIRC
jgi:branched-chain amino acid transport system substrate-binding protein